MDRKTISSSKVSLHLNIYFMFCGFTETADLTVGVITCVNRINYRRP